MDVRNKIRQFIESELLSDQKGAHLSVSEPLITTGIIDSLSIMKLIAYLEKTFSVRIEDEEIIAENFETIDVISSVIEKKIG